MPSWNADMGGTGDESELRGLRAMGEHMATSLLLLACCSVHHWVSTMPGISPFQSCYLALQVVINAECLPHITGNPGLLQGFCNVRHVCKR